MKNKKDSEKSLLKDQLNSTQIDMFQSEPTKTSELINRFLNNNSKMKSVESENIDLHDILFLFIVVNSLLFISSFIILEIKASSLHFISFKIKKTPQKN